MALEKELSVFLANHVKWLQTYENKFVLIVGDDLVGAFDDPKTAYETGIERYGNVPMLIKQVKREEETAFFPALTLGLIHADPHH